MSWRSKINFGLLACFLASFLACDATSNDGTDQGELLAEVHNKKLFYGDIENMMQTGLSEADSLAWLNAIIEKWVKESLFLYEAERNLPPDINIDELVKDYRATLILNQYEKNYVEMKLDSTISEAELNEYYENNKDQYQLQTPIVRVHYLKIKRNLPGHLIKKIEKFWSETDKKKSFNELLSIADRYGEDFLLNKENWYTLSDISGRLPAGSINDQIIRYSKDFSFTDGDFKYFVTFFELKSRQDVAPLSYIKDQATRVILNKRKLELIRSRKEELYQTETQNNNVKIFLE